MAPRITIGGPGRLVFARGVVLAAAICTTLGACSLNRALAVKKQFCEFEENFALLTGSQPALVFKSPVIRARDVQRLIGAGPTQVSPRTSGPVHRYVIEQVFLDDTEPRVLRFDLWYLAAGKRLELQSVHFPQELLAMDRAGTLTDREAIATAAEEVCSSELKFGFPAMEEEIDPAYLERLPTRSEVLAIAGPPSFESEEERALIYEYRLRGDEAAQPALRVVLWFDETGQQPVRMESRYRKLRTRADFLSGRIRHSYGA